ncbi:MAG: hypothetical protein AAF821_08220 [Cyanobacteria bacterium P01_D01_bin.156]
MDTSLSSQTNEQPNWKNDGTLSLVRPEVRKILQASPGFAKLSPDDQRQLAQSMVDVSSYMVNPDGLAAQELSSEGGILSQTQADATETARKRAASDPGFAGEDFEAGAVRQGTEQFGELVNKVDFPAFVSGLIENVFQAIVNSSIQQMKAYGELLANVAKTVDQFAQDNITENNARDWLAERFPDKLGVEVEQGSFGFADGDIDTQTAAKPKLQVTAEDESEALKTISSELDLKEPITDISEESQERRLVLAARLQIARSRQQLLASMVMLGINRIVVTDGQINAKVVFGMRASDIARRQSKASLYDRSKSGTEAKAGASFGGWFSPVQASASVTSRTSHLATVQSSLDETSASKAEVKAKLTGEVRVNFKSDYMPMEKMASPQMIAAIQGNAQPPKKKVDEA